MSYVQGLEAVVFVALVTVAVLLTILRDVAITHERRMETLQAKIDELTRKNNLYSEFQSAVDRLSLDLDSNLEN